MRRRYCDCSEILPHGTRQPLNLVIYLSTHSAAGQNRCGLPDIPSALELGRLVASLPGLELNGLQVYHGKAQHIRAVADRRVVCEQVAMRAAAIRVRFTDLSVLQILVLLITSAAQFVLF